MIPISSAIEGIQATFQEIKEQLEPEDFHLGGGYTYEHGYFDKALDWEEEHGNRYYLRIPAYSIQGDIGDPDTLIELGRPFVIKHEFRTGNDPTSDSGLVSALVNQFSKPIPTEDHPIDDKWIKRARSVLETVEEKLLPRNR